MSPPRVARPGSDPGRPRDPSSGDDGDRTVPGPTIPIVEANTEAAGSNPVDYLSAEWLEALDEAVRSDEALAELTAGHDLVIEQVVERAPGDAVVWQVHLVDGSPRVEVGAGARPTVRFTTDLATAEAITTGREAPQAAFLRGDLRIGGDTAALAAHRELLASVSDLTATLRDRTVFPGSGS